MSIEILELINPKVINKKAIDSSNQVTNSREKRSIQSSSSSYINSINRNVERTVSLPTVLSLQELADKLQIPPKEIIKTLFLRGVKVNINEKVSFEFASSIAEEFGLSVERQKEDKGLAFSQYKKQEKPKEQLSSRPPIVTVMGHVDHGKTTLLDTLRENSTSEVGNITQKLLAYQVEVDYEDIGKNITFLDTPGHEAFSAIRSRGSRLTDIVVLVIAVDEGIKPQTEEAIQRIKENNIPLVVAITKVDKSQTEAEIEEIKTQLTKYEIIWEQWGGETFIVPLSTIQKYNLKQLLDSILIVAEIQQLKANFNTSAEGVVLESHLDRRRGAIATILIYEGTLHIGDYFVVGSTYGRVRWMLNDKGEKVKSATPSSPIQIFGTAGVPFTGETLTVVESLKKAKRVAEERESSVNFEHLTTSRINNQSNKILNLILKADLQGSIEAIFEALRNLPQHKVGINVIYASTGEVTSNDMELAITTNANIIAFNSGSKLPRTSQSVKIYRYEVIYDLIDGIRGMMEEMLEPEYVQASIGKAKVLTTFKIAKGIVAGCYVEEGKISRGSKVVVKRNNHTLHEGFLTTLKRIKEDVKEVTSGFECGIFLEDFSNWKEEDLIECFQLVPQKPSLS